MTQASVALKKQQGTFTDPSDYERATQGVDLDNFLIDLVGSKDLDFDLREAITSGYIERTMDGASTIQVVVHDAQRNLLRSGILGDGTESHFPAIDVNVDGLWFRLVAVEKRGPELTLTFEDRWVSWLRLKKGAVKVSRGKMTRAQFVRKLVNEVKKNGGLLFFAPELNKRQAVAGIKKTAAEKHKNKDPGLHASATLNVKGTKATKNQITYGDDILTTGATMGANRKCLIASIMVAIQESGIDPTANDFATGTHIGIFQQDSAPGSVWKKLGGASRDASKDAKAFFTQCIKADQDNPNLQLFELCEAVQRSGQPRNYDKWKTEAKHWVDEFDNNGGASTSRTFIKAYEFHRGAPDGPNNENTWDATKRLADEVRWRRFIVGNRFYFIHDTELMQAKPVAVISEDQEEIDWIDFDLDQGKAVAEATVECRANRWFAPPGSVVMVQDHGMATGRWLVWTIHRDLFSEHATITLRQPESQKKEPAPEQATSTSDSGSNGIISAGHVGGTSVKNAIANAARLALKRGPTKYKYGQVRPLPPSLFPTNGSKVITTDCSGFAILCYKAAGAPDPGGTGSYSGGNTSTLWANGDPVHSDKIEEGDLVFYSNPDHVMVYVGNGEVIGMGGNPDPTKAPVAYRNIRGFRKYTVGSNNPPPYNYDPYGSGPAGGHH